MIERTNGKRNVKALVVAAARDVQVPGCRLRQSFVVVCEIVVSASNSMHMCVSALYMCNAKVRLCVSAIAGRRVCRLTLLLGSAEQIYDGQFACNDVDNHVQ